MRRVLAVVVALVLVSSSAGATRCPAAQRARLAAALPSLQLAWTRPVPSPSSPVAHARATLEPPDGWQVEISATWSLDRLFDPDCHAPVHAHDHDHVHAHDHDHVPARVADHGPVRYHSSTARPALPTALRGPPTVTVPVENRAHPRYAVDVECRLRVGDTDLVGRSKDISRSGTSCIAPAPLDVGSLVDLDLALTFEEGAQSEPLRLPAVVVWCTRVAAGYQLGLKFNHTTPELVHFLDVFVQYLEGELDE